VTGDQVVLIAVMGVVGGIASLVAFALGRAGRPIVVRPADVVSRSDLGVALKALPDLNEYDWNGMSPESQENYIKILTIVLDRFPSDRGITPEDCAGIEERAEELL
jgi:hypothetical protein